ncbi:hypothetical protein BDY17DRAFT_325542 [Neohortaea acidophila]|uniref:Isopenicillin N synthase-like Fe(2+) 2OG dioxygenase domain-containing protein n=1 Tax=Neohortaea acidophila TaxID=245834 RepID=A0A6A6PQG9_9PEZI|nr:uncharacterized protein BDY17DRAFT_325542 [Neohortaea acidophila]KAF2482046.1 hypothetical protein BDY17DRAFT_325542 [Neohortaea acidophila]
MGGEVEGHSPPPGPPPLLTEQEASFLSRQGWMPCILPEPLRSELDCISTEAATFFRQDHATKSAIYPPRNGTECGYYVVPDEKEYITFRHRQHDDSALESHVRAAWKLAANLLRRVLYDLSTFHGFDPTVWEGMIQGCLELPSNDANLDTDISLMRVFQYHPNGLAEQHTDVGLVTLCVGGDDGLQMVDHTKTPKVWTSARWPVILIGEVASALMRGKAQAGVHRVVKNAAGRGSVVFTLRPCLKGTIDLKRFGGEGLVNVRDLFYKIKAEKHNINATQDLREQQRQELHRKRLGAEVARSPEPR